MKIATLLRRSCGPILLTLFFFGFWGCPDYSRTPVSNAHHYVYEHGQYVPQYYRYDPFPNYRAFTHNFPPYYTARDLGYYEGLDHGRFERFDRVDNSFYHQ